LKGAGDAETDFDDGVLGHAEGRHCGCGHGLRVCWHLAFVGVVRRDVTGNVSGLLACRCDRSGCFADDCRQGLQELLAC